MSKQKRLPEWGSLPRANDKKCFYKRDNLYCFSFTCHTPSTSFLFDSCPYKCDRQPISLVKGISSPPPLTPALSKTLTMEKMCITTWSLSLPQTSKLLWGSGAVRGSRPLMQSHDFLSWPSSAPTLPPSPPSDRCRCGAVLLQPTQGEETEAKGLIFV